MRFSSEVMTRIYSARGGTCELRGPFHGSDEGVGVGHRRQVIDAAGVGQELRVGAVLAHLLLHPVDVAADRFGADDVFAVHRHLDAQHAVGGRMLRAQVEDEGLARRAVGGDSVMAVLD